MGATLYYNERALAIFLDDLRAIRQASRCATWWIRTSGY